jgi:hypothetical protein
MNWNAKAKQGRRLVLLAGVGVLLCAWQAVAAIQPPSSELVSRRSYSGQFIAYAARSARLPPALSSIATNQDFVQLEPTLATVSCERIKQILLRELNVKTPWRGTIYLVLYPAGGVGDTITITSESFRNGWQYRVELPTVVERPRYVRAIVRVLLQELANRTTRESGAEIPAWLVEGFSQHLLAASEVQIILSPPCAAQNGFNVSGSFVASHKQTLLQQVIKKLGGRPPLTFEALSWPSEQDLADGAGGQAYRGSAQLFVGELLRIPDGYACLQTMLARLPQHYNWQFAFLEAFHTHFQRPLDVEKWWALAIAQAGMRYPAQPWPLTESWRKLDQAVHAAVQVRTRANELPLRAEVSLQTVIREGDPNRQTQALNDALRELGLARLHIAQEYAGLVQDYRQTIETYLQLWDGGASNSPFAGSAAEAAILQLDVLDARRMALQPGSKPGRGSPSPAPSPQARP